MKRITILILALFLLTATAYAQDADPGDTAPATIEAVASEAAPVAPDTLPEVEAPAPVADDIPRWFQLVLDNIEYVVWVVVFFLLYRSVPAGAFEKGLKNAKEGAAQTPSKDDDRLVAILEGIYGLIRGIEQRNVTATLEVTTDGQSSKSLPVAVADTPTTAG